ncbi:tetratricopeptide repeat protein [Azospirillum soli]|uniref:tetratricopeptide repeat protein n=1 Tax=Azospirillum soli TaxID=1304799 RepID=UPI001AE3954D|nr:tetratricopeptide repeat protein [Azospirillum soli]MBP2311296.1 TolB-like protein [Azospirillum soli]
MGATIGQGNRMPHASDSHGFDAPVAPELIDEALARVLASRSLRSSARGRRFLQFIVQEAQAGRADRIKAYTIAMDVFDRDADFDASLDPVVRIQAGRLRQALEHYYLTEGTDDPVRISIPKGSYVPHFLVQPRTPLAGRLEDVQATAAPETSGSFITLDEQEQDVNPDESATPPSATSELLPPFRASRPRMALAAGAVLAVAAFLLLITAWGGAFAPSRPDSSPPDMERTVAIRGPSLLVLPFANATGDPAQDLFADGFTEDLIGALIRFKNVLVYGADTSFRYRSALAPSMEQPETPIDYMIKGSIGQNSNQLQITVSLIRAKDHRYLWSDSFRHDLSPTTMLDLRQDIAAQVARALAQSHGAIQQEEMRVTAKRPPQELSSYECMVRTRQYWRQPNAETHRQMRGCLERAVKSDPLYADAWAALAMVTIDEARLGFNPRAERPDPVGAGLRMALHAAALAPDNPLPLQALGLAHWLSQEPELSIAAYEQALALNPNDSDILADLGRCYGVIGEWQKGIPLIREAFARNPAHPNWYRIVIALYHYMNGRYDEALAEAERVDLPQVILTHVALAMIHGQAGHKAEATQAVQAILRLDPNFGERAVAEFKRRNIPPATTTKIVEGLQKAGLAVVTQGPSLTDGR